MKLMKKPDSDRNVTLADIVQEEPRIFYGDELDEYISEIKGINVVIRKAYGLLGFIKFLKGYYIIMITEKKKIAKIGRHNIYKVKDIVIKPLFRSTPVSGTTPDNREEEAKYVQAFKDIEMAKGFYYSYTYDITHSLQYNVLRQVNKVREKSKEQNDMPY
jgi:phosphatidylinositol 3,5-bisphosphate 5-phosphatase